MLKCNARFLYEIKTTADVWTCDSAQNKRIFQRFLTRSEQEPWTRIFNQIFITPWSLNPEGILKQWLPLKDDFGRQPLSIPCLPTPRSSCFAGASTLNIPEVFKGTIGSGSPGVVSGSQTKWLTYLIKYINFSVDYSQACSLWVIQSSVLHAMNQNGLTFQGDDDFVLAHDFWTFHLTWNHCMQFS